MMTFLTHPEHGTHIAYTDSEVALCQKNGWTVRPEIQPEVVQPATNAEVIASALGIPCAKCGKVLTKGRVMHERFCKGA